MIKPPTEKRNYSPELLEKEREHINMLNDVLGDIELTPAEEGTLIWLCRWETEIVQNIVSVFEKIKLRRNKKIR